MFTKRWRLAAIVSTFFALTLSIPPALAAEQVGPKKPLPPDKPVTVQFSAQGDAFSLPAPSGLCPPTAAYSDRVQQISAMLEKTHLVFGAALLPCDPTSLSSRTPIALLVGSMNSPDKVPGSRESFVKQASSLLRTQAGQTQIQSGLDQANAIAKDKLGKAMNVSAKPTVVDQDEYAAYIFSNVQVTTGDVQKAVVAIEALTVVKGRVIVIAIMAPPGSMDDAKALLALIKLETKNFIDANEDLQG
jgi:hypothetical protein